MAHAPSSATLAQAEQVLPTHNWPAPQEADVRQLAVVQVPARHNLPAPHSPSSPGSAQAVHRLFLQTRPFPQSVVVWQSAVVQLPPTHSWSDPYRVLQRASSVVLTHTSHFAFWHRVLPPQPLSSGQVPWVQALFWQTLLDP